MDWTPETLFTGFSDGSSSCGRFELLAAAASECESGDRKERWEHLWIELRRVLRYTVQPIGHGLQKSFIFQLFIFYYCSPHWNKYFYVPTFSKYQKIKIRKNKNKNGQISKSLFRKKFITIRNHNQSKQFFVSLSTIWRAIFCFWTDRKISKTDPKNRFIVFFEIPIFALFSIFHKFG